VGIDPSAPFVEYARTHNTDPRVTFQLGDAHALPYDAARFDAAFALLVINFIPDANKAASEMRRVTRSGGAVATAMWDNTGRNELMRTFWDAAVALDPGVKREDLRPGAFGSTEALTQLWATAGLRNIETKELSIDCDFTSFDDYWSWPRDLQQLTSVLCQCSSATHSLSLLRSWTNCGPRSFGYKKRPQDIPFLDKEQVITNACAWGSICNAGAGMGK
jgi:SAM-dependent methyltransferase